MKTIFIAIFSLFCFHNSSAQDNTQEALKQINAIKVDTKKYIYAESTAADWNDAFQNAKALLEVNIEEWAKNNGKEKDIAGCYAKAENSILEIKTKRGNLYRVFLYVKKSDITTYSSESSIVDIPINKTETSNSNIQTADENGEIAISVPNEKKGEVSDLQPYPENSFFEANMLKVESFDFIKSFIKGMQITKYGKYKDLPSEGDCYLFVYAQTGDIVAYLIRQNGAFVNLITGEKDNIENYKGCGAIWLCR